MTTSEDKENLYDDICKIWIHVTSALLTAAAFSGKARETKTTLINAIKAHPVKDDNSIETSALIYALAVENLMVSVTDLAERIESDG